MLVLLSTGSGKVYRIATVTNWRAMSECAQLVAGHNTFSKNQLVNDVVGTLVFAPLVYPFEPWRIKVKWPL
jgi:hypothetical protein